MKLLIAVLMFFVTSISYAIDNEASSADLDYCKVSYTNKADGSTGTYGGQCKNNVPHGSGVVTFYNGDKLSGEFVQGDLSGEGVFEAVSGDNYKGGWDDGKRNGQGTYHWARGSSYVGEWLDDKRHGDGVFTWSNGNRFEGEFRDNKRYNGKYYTSNGRVYKCRLGQCK
jgi:hypothetical protein